MSVYLPFFLETCSDETQASTRIFFGFSLGEGAAVRLILRPSESLINHFHSWL